MVRTSIDQNVFEKPTSATVLLIDDDPDQLLLFKTLLEKKGFAVSTVDNAADGLATMAQKFFDVVVTDLQMPDVSGFAVIHQIRQIRTFPADSKIPVVMLTATESGLSNIAARARQLGADDFCEKRHAKAYLADKLRRLLPVSTPVSLPGLPW